MLLLISATILFLVSCEKPTGSENPLTGKLKVISSPDSAEIWLNGDSTGHLTPHTFNDVEPGSYIVDVRLTGYFNHLDTVYVEAGHTITSSATLISNIGNLTINSSPTNSEIWLDNDSTGHSTPYTFEGLSVGNHPLTLKHAGYSDWIDTVYVIANYTGTINAELSPLSAHGHLSVASIPSEAKIWLDGEDTGYLTTHYFNNVLADTHCLKLEKEGYHDWEQDIIISANQTTTVNAQLAMISTSGTLVINSSPVEANIWLDETNTAYLTPHTFENIASGSHLIKLKKNGYYDWIDTLNVAIDETLTVNAELELIPPTGSLYISSWPNGALIWLNDESTGYTAPHNFSNILADTYSIKLALDGYYDWIKDTVVVANQTTTVQGVLEPMPGNIYVVSQPAGAQIWLDDEFTNKFTPDTLIVAEAGEYELRLLSAGHFPVDTTVNIGIGQSITWEINLDETPNYKLAYSRHDSLFMASLDGLNNNPVAGNVLTINNICWSPDGNFLAYNNDDYQIVILNADGSVENALPFTSSDRATDFSWSHSSQYLVNGSYTEGIYRYDTNSGTFSWIYATPGFRYDHNPAFSVNDQKIACVHHEYGSTTRLMTMNADGSNTNFITSVFTTGYDENLDLCWISNEQLIHKIGSAGIFLVTVLPDTSRVNIFSEPISNLRVSEDHSYYAYTASGGIYYGSVGVWEPNLLTSQSANSLCWSSDNSAIICLNIYGVRWVETNGKTYWLYKWPYQYSVGGVSVAPE